MSVNVHGVPLVRYIHPSLWGSNQWEVNVEDIVLMTTLPLGVESEYSVLPQLPAGQLYT